MTDRAAFRADGRLHSIVPKMVISHRLNAVLAASGTVTTKFESYAGEWLAVQPDLETMLARLPWLLEINRQKEQASNPAGDHTRSTRLVVAYWECGPQARLIRGSEESGEWAVDPIQAFHVHVLPEVKVDFNRRRFDRKEAIRLIDRQRRTLGREGYYAVGGAADLTTISARGIATETIREWDDRLGDLIAP